MIVTVTPNPSLDRTLHLTRLEPGEVNRATATMTEPSGKGVNVALALHGVGVEVCAVLPVGGGTGREISSALALLGLDVVGVPIAGALRSNVSLVEADGRSTKVNEQGPALSAEEVDALCESALSARAADRMLWAGSLPEGFTVARLAGAVADARTAGRWVAVDASGPALAAVLKNDRGGLPNLVKPNADELAEVLGVALHTLGDVAAAARTLLDRGVRTVLVSLGGNGALLVDADLPQPLHGSAPVGRVVNSVGAGDAFLAGFLSEPAGGAEALATALRFGATAVEHDGTLLSVPDPRRPVHVGPARTDLPLS